MAFTNMFFVSAAYQAVVAPLMLQEAGFYAERLNLPEPLPLTAAVAKVAVNPPLLGGLGHVATTNYFYSFPLRDEKPLTNACGVSLVEYGKLAYVMRKTRFQVNGREIMDPYDEMAALPSQVDTNGAYRLATQWLAAVQVDVAALERDYKPMVVQQAFCDPPLTLEQGLNPPANAPRKLLPIFDVTWGGPEHCSPPVWVGVFGPTKELALLRMENTTYSRRPAIVVTNALELCGLPQPPAKPPGTPPHRVTVGDYLRVSQAYSNVAFKLLLAEADFFAERLRLPLPRPLTWTNALVHVSSPTYYSELGGVEVGGYHFQFFGEDAKPGKNEYGLVRCIEPGKLTRVFRPDLPAEFANEDGELAERAYDLPCLLDPASAYRLATQWLAAVQVDVAALEREHKPSSVQVEYNQPNGSRRKTPLFVVTWGGPPEKDPPVRVLILGVTKELIELGLNDTRFLQRSPIIIKNARELNSLPDPPAVQPK
jgi:hypothetical protein